MLAVFPLTTARDRRWWSHCRSQGVPGVAWNVNEFICETAQEGGSGLAVHTCGFDCNWLKVVIVKKVIVFPAFVGLSASVATLPGIAALTMFM